MVLAAVRKVVSTLREEQRTDAVVRRALRRATDDAGVAGTRVLVTGSTRGIGLALAEAFVAQGAHVVVHGRRDAEARQVARRLSRAGRSGGVARVVGVGADLSASGSGGALVASAITALGGLDLVISNAGVHDPALKPVWETSSEEMTAVLRVNVLAAFEVCSAAVAHLVERGAAGRVVLVSTLAAKTDEVYAGGIASYGVSKIALEGLAHFLAAEAGPHGVTVATVRPGTVDTAMVAPFFPLDKRLRMLPATSLVAPVLHLATAPHDEVHGRFFDQHDLLEELGGAAPAGAEATSA